MTVMGIGMTLREARKAKGIENTAPTMVPIKAMAAVSRSKWSTPLSPKPSKVSKLGWKIPLIILKAMVGPFSEISIEPKADQDQTMRTTKPSTHKALKYLSEVRDSYISLILLIMIRTS